MPPVDFENAAKLLILLGTTGTVIIGLRLLSAWARRVSRGPTRDMLDAASTQGEVGALREQVERLTGEMGELQERVDFAERMLARQKDAPRLKE